MIRNTYTVTINTLHSSDWNALRAITTTLHYEGEQVVVERGPQCWVCNRGGSGLTELPDGRVVHRWPCRERMSI